MGMLPTAGFVFCNQVLGRDPAPPQGLSCTRCLNIPIEWKPFGALKFYLPCFPEVDSAIRADAPLVKLGRVS